MSDTGSYGGTSTRSDGQEGSPLISRVSSSTVENCILLETSETDSSLAADEALFYENGTLSARKTAGKLDRSLIGVYGTLVIGKKGDNVAVGVVPDTASRQETYEVVNAAADRIVTKTGAFRPNRDTPTYLSRDSSAEDSKLKSLAEVWSSILPGDTLHAYYNEYGCPARHEYFSRQHLRLRYCHLGKHPERIQDRQEWGCHRPVRPEKV